MLFYKTERALGCEQYVQRSKVEQVTRVCLPDRKKQDRAENRYSEKVGRGVFPALECVVARIRHCRKQEHLIRKAVSEEGVAKLSALDDKSVERCLVFRPFDVMRDIVGAVNICPRGLLFKVKQHAAYAFLAYASADLLNVGFGSLGSRVASHGVHKVVVLEAPQLAQTHHHPMGSWHLITVGAFVGNEVRGFQSSGK